MEEKTGAKIAKNVVTMSIITLLAASSLCNLNPKKVDVQKEIEKMVYGSSHEIEESTTITNPKNDNNNINKYIYLPLGKSAPEPVRYVETEVSDDKIYTINGIEYKLCKTVIFYTDYEDKNSIANKFSGHLNLGEIIKFSNMENGTSKFLVYERYTKK